jgi:hypothetical protein
MVACLMPLRSALFISLVIAVLAAPASALAADVVAPSSVAASTTVPAGGSRTLTLRCPAAAVALNAAVTRRGAGVTVRRSIPGSSSGDWRFRLSADAGARRRGVRAVLRCVRLALPPGVSGTRIVVSTRRSPTFNIAAGSRIAAQIGCPAGFVATGYGLDRGGRRAVTIAAAVPTAHGWNFTLENTGASSARARFTDRCLKSAVSARRGGAPTQMTFGVAQRRFSNAIGAGGAGTFTHSCARSEFSVATGSELDASDAIELSGSYPVRSRSGHWKFSHASAGDRVSSFLVCLSRRTQFG